MAKKSHTPQAPLPRIFVQIASYRDTECHFTLNNLFEKAAHPERIFVGICWQYDPVADAHCLEVDYPRPEQVRVVQYHIRDAQGAGWARNQAQSLWQGEEYVLQIHAHMRFEQGWDEMLIDMLGRCPSDKPVLSTYLPPYRTPDTRRYYGQALSRTRVRAFAAEGDPQILHLTQLVVRAHDAVRCGLYPSPFWVGNFLFARSALLREVPHDPHIYFYGEELAYSVRLFTHGWDIFQPDQVVMFHQWDRREMIVKEGDSYQTQGYRHSKDVRNIRSFKRVKHLLGIEKSSEKEALKQIDNYGLGKARSLERFFAFANIDMHRRAVSAKAEQGFWNMAARESAGKAAELPRIFVNIASYRDPECQATVRDLFTKAAYPERIFIGICLQIDPVEDRACMVESDRPEQLRLRQVHYKESAGANWARCQAQSLWRGEEYILQIDSHMRVETGWDEMLIDMLGRCTARKPVISGCVPGYKPPDEKQETPGQMVRVGAHMFGDPGNPQLLHLVRIYVPLSDKERCGLYPTPFYSANFLFCDAAAFEEVPLDPHIQFWGDEITYSARLWTHGWDIFQPDQLVIYHYWRRDDMVHMQPYRKVGTPESQICFQRIQHVLGFELAAQPEALTDIAMYGLGSERMLDDLWVFAGIDWQERIMTKDATQGRWNMAAREKALMDTSHKLPRIFVQIASYRDPDCQRTVKDLFEKAAHPERIFVGICWQYVEGEDDVCFTIPYPRPNQVRVYEVDAHKSQGVCWARNITQSLWEDEEFTLQIDSHMRFEPGWDEKLLSMWQNCASEKAVLTCYPPGFTPPDKLERDWVFGMGASQFDANGIFLMRGAPPFRVGSEPLTPIPGAFASACMLFGPSSIIADVPYDPYLYFFGEEISLAVRLWTHGYDIYHPNGLVLYHDWDRSKRSTHFDDHRDWGVYNDRAQARVRHMLGTEVSDDPHILQEMEKYGLGTVRSLAQYQDYSGVDFARKTVADFAQKGIFKPYAQDKAASGLPRIFVQIASYRDQECQWTVKDLFEKAAHPDRIFVGICWQFDEKLDQDCFKISTRPDQVRVFPVDWRDAEGVCWARNITQSLWDGEEYCLQIDSHMRFVPGWDELMLAELAACASEKAILSCNPASYTPPNQLQQSPKPTIRRVKPFSPDGNIRGQGEYIMRTPELPLRGAFLSAAFMFSRSELIHEVPYDPYMYFDQEEITYAARFYTYGWDVFSARKQFLYHYYNGTESVRPLHWQDLREESNNERINYFYNRGIKRLNHLTGYKISTEADVIQDIGQYGFGQVRTLAQFEEFTGLDFKRKIASERALRCLFIEGLEKYIDRPLHIPELDDPNRRVDVTKGKPAIINENSTAKQVDADKGKSRIFVNIASYRDPECQWTVKDLFEKAAYPDRIFVGICWQFDEEEDKECFQVITRPDQVRVMPVDWREAEGVCWARYMTEQLWDGEEYSLMIDSHMRFVPGWDEAMIAELALCDSPKPVLSCPPPGYTPPNELAKNPKTTVRRIKPFFQNGNIRGQGEVLDRVPEKPVKGVLMVANFVFARSDILKEVPYDPYLYFDQEEIMYAVRLYTHGWEIFSPRTPMLYHYYNDGPQGSVRPLHWKDLKKEDEKKIAFYNDRGLKRMNHMTGYKLSEDPEVVKELHIYGFGRLRTLAQFEAFTGIDFKRKVASERALRAWFIEDLAKYRNTPIIVPELDGKSSKASATVPAVLPAAGTLRMLDVGDFMPFFALPDGVDHIRAMEIYAGRVTMMFYLPVANLDYAGKFFRHLKYMLGQGKKMHIWHAIIMDGTVEELAQIKEKLAIDHLLWSDSNRAVARALGLAGEGAVTVPPAGFLLNRNLKIIRRHLQMGPEQLVNVMVDDCRKAVEHNQLKNATPRVISEMAPALIVPDALSPELCRKCIETFRTGKTFDGTVGAEEKTAYTPTAKIRTDYIVGGPLLAELDEKLSASLFPEVEKIFGFKVTHRELYKIGLYTGEKGGFFKAHRDNFDEPLGYRRVATTIHLSDNYEGGGLRFPEYSDDIYRPPLGAAISFSGSTFHEALPVTKGERFIIVAFLHGEQDEAYRRYYLNGKGMPDKREQYTPALRPETVMKTSRDFIRKWQREHVVIHAAAQKAITAPVIHSEAKAIIMPDMPKPTIMINRIGEHQPKKVFESAQGIIFDDFLPEDVYEKVSAFALTTDYEYINTKGKISRAWHVHDGFPMRSMLNGFYHADQKNKPTGDHVYPTKTAFDPFIDNILSVQSQVEHLIGKIRSEWAHFSVTSWIYPHGTGLSMHDDGSGVYTGAYVYFLNPVWRPHWGGLLMLVEEGGNKLVHEYREKQDQMDFYKRKWLHANDMDEKLMEYGFAKCIFPKRNRIVFIANDAYHMVTKVNEQAGDNLRMSLAGFFDRKK